MVKAEGKYTPIFTHIDVYKPINKFNGSSVTLLTSGEVSQFSTLNKVVGKKTFLLVCFTQRPLLDVYVKSPLSVNCYFFLPTAAEICGVFFSATPFVQICQQHNVKPHM